jgi:hypothetical protein
MKYPVERHTVYEARTSFVSVMPPPIIRLTSVRFPVESTKNIHTARTDIVAWMVPTIYLLISGGLDDGKRSNMTLLIMKETKIHDIIGKSDEGFVPRSKSDNPCVLAKSKTRYLHKALVDRFVILH